MDFFIGSKILQAELMTLGEFNHKTGRDVSPEKDPVTEGYHVVYEHGYESWSPREVFEKDYISLGDLSGAKDVVKNMVGEYTQIKVRCEKLIDLTGTDAYTALMGEERRDIASQLHGMSLYLYALKSRISRISPEIAERL